MPPSVAKDVVKARKKAPNKTFTQGYYEIPSAEGGKPTPALLMDWVGEYFGFKKIQSAGEINVTPIGAAKIIDAPNSPQGTKGGDKGCSPCRDRKLIQVWLGIRWVGLPFPVRIWRALIYGADWHTYPGCGCIWKLKMGVYLFKQFWGHWKKQ